MSSHRKADRRRGAPGHPRAEALEPRHLLSTITVTTTADQGPGVFVDDLGALSLRQAIAISNGDLAVSSLSPAQAALVVGPPGSPNTIDFNIPGTGPFVFRLAGLQLPAISRPAVIDGYSQPGAHPNTGGPGQADNASILIELTGFYGPDLEIAAGDTTVQGLSIDAISFSDFAFSAGVGIVLEGRGGDLIQGCFVGVDPSGTTATQYGQGAVGIADFIPAGSAAVTIGGTTPASRNVLSGVSSGTALEVSDALVEGNFIGTDTSGARALGNQIGITARPGTTVGGTAAGAGNVISGNTGDGILVDGTYPFNVGPTGSPPAGYAPPPALIQGNRIGTDAAGAGPLGNGTGVVLKDIQATVGGTAPGAGNVISGNRGDGLDTTVTLYYGETYPSHTPVGALIQGNRIGTDAAGGSAVPTGGLGLGLASFSDTVGGTAAGAGNVISGNGLFGVRVSSLFTEVGDAFPITLPASALLEGNFIGTDAAGATPLGNGKGGVLVDGSATIGGTAAGAGNVIAANVGPGVQFGNSIAPGETIYTRGHFGATVSRNAIFVNQGPGILITLPASPYTPPTNVLAAPVLASATPDGSGTSISGTLDARPSTAFAIEFFLDPDGTGQGRTYLGTTISTTDASGHASSRFDAVPLPAGQHLTATATATMVDAFSSSGDTSEFSADLLVQVPSTTTQILPDSTASATPADPIVVDGLVAAASGPAVPSGVATLIEDGRPAPSVGPATLDPAGHFRFVVPPQAAGTHSFAVAYGGSTGFAASTSDPLVVAVAPVAPTVSLEVPAFSDSPESITVVVSTPPGAPTATGAVAIAIDGVVQPASDLVAVDGHSAATLTASGLAPGPHTLQAAYYGDARYAPANAPPAFTAIVAGTTTALSSFPAAPVAGQPLALVATVTAAPGSGPLTGSVTFIDHFRAIGSAPLDGSGRASILIAAPEGPDVFEAVYSGVPEYSAPSLSGIVAVSAAKVTPTVVLLGPSNISVVGQALPFVAGVVPTGGIVPTGFVAFAEAGVVLAVVPLDGNGLATFITSALPPGPHVIAAVYLGDASDAPSLSNYVAQGVLAAAPARRKAGSVARPAKVEAEALDPAPRPSGAGVGAGAGVVVPVAPRRVGRVAATASAVPAASVPAGPRKKR